MRQNPLLQVKSQHNRKIIRRRWIEELLLAVINNGRNGNNRCAINETAYASGNSRKGGIQMRNGRNGSMQVHNSRNDSIQIRSNRSNNTQ